MTSPSIEVITPRSGTFPFLKVTFLSGGDKKEFMNLNKVNPNKYITQYMAPQCLSAREREIKTALVKEISAWLTENGYHTLEKTLASSE